MATRKRERIWTKDRLKYLCENYSKKLPKEIAEDLGLSINAVRQRACLLRLTAKRDVRVAWTEEKLDYLREHYYEDSNTSIAKKLGCCSSTVKDKAKKLGLEKKKKKDNICVYDVDASNREPHFGYEKDIGTNKSEVTNCTRTLVCSCALDGITVHQTALMTCRTDEQIEAVLKECKESGYYAWMKRRREDPLDVFS